MKVKEVLSIILGIIAIISFIVFIRNVQDIDNFVTSFWSCLITAVSVAILLIWNSWLVGKK